MPGSFGRFSGPLLITTNCAVNLSPRSVRIVQAFFFSFHFMPVTPVLSRALSNRLKWSAIRFECARISGAFVYFSFGMKPVSSSSGR